MPGLSALSKGGSCVPCLKSAYIYSLLVSILPPCCCLLPLSYLQQLIVLGFGGHRPAVLHGLLELGGLCDHFGGGFVCVCVSMVAFSDM